MLRRGKKWIKKDGLVMGLSSELGGMVFDNVTSVVELDMQVLFVKAVEPYQVRQLDALASVFKAYDDLKSIALRLTDDQVLIVPRFERRG